jgi:hypothetical protein
MICRRVPGRVLGPPLRSAIGWGRSIEACVRFVAILRTMASMS